MSCSCKYCGSKNVYHIARIVGYFSIVEDWNRGKIQERIHRQKGNYMINEEEGKK